MIGLSRVCMEKRQNGTVLEGKTGTGTHTSSGRSVFKIYMKAA